MHFLISQISYWCLLVRCLIFRVLEHQSDVWLDFSAQSVQMHWLLSCEFLVCHTLSTVWWFIPCAVLEGFWGFQSQLRLVFCQWPTSQRFLPMLTSSHSWSFLPTVWLPAFWQSTQVREACHDHRKTSSYQAKAHPHWSLQVVSWTIYLFIHYSPWFSFRLPLTAAVRDHLWVFSSLIRSYGAQVEASGKFDRDRSELALHLCHAFRW